MEIKYVKILSKRKVFNIKKFIMKLIKKKIINSKNAIYSIDFINDNGFKFSFLNLGCYIKNIIIPYPNFRKSER